MRCIYTVLGQMPGGSLREMLESAVTPEREKASAKGLQLSTSLDPSLPETTIGDAARIRDILQHLIDNAIKFRRNTLDGNDGLPSECGAT